MELNFDQIKEILPHRYPFIMIDKIIELEENKYAKGIKCVSNGEYYFNGHFPQKAIMPGVLQIEAVAQVGATCLLLNNKDYIALLAGVKRTRFYKEVTPGDVLEIKCEMIKKVKNLGFAKGIITRQNKNGEVEKIMTCEISFALA